MAVFIILKYINGCDCSTVRVKWFKYIMPPKKSYISQRESQSPSGVNNTTVPQSWITKRQRIDKAEVNREPDVQFQPSPQKLQYGGRKKLNAAKYIIIFQKNIITFIWKK